MRAKISLAAVGPKFLVEPQGTTLSSDEISILSEMRPVSVAFRKRNFIQDAPYEEWITAFRDLLEDIKKATGHDRLIVAIDHEGGRVHRFPSTITNFAYQAQWGDKTGEVADAICQELRACGINLIFGPVVDIHSNPANPVINQRAFGRSAEEVNKMAQRFFRAAEKNDIQTCAKHFPGHGDTGTDSHYVLPVLNYTLEELRQRELQPFIFAIQQGVPAIMTAHLALPQIDRENIATLSTVLLNDLLRKELGFEGVIMADALGMAAIMDKLADPAAHIAAAAATLDLYLVMGDKVSMKDAHQWATMMRDLVNNGEIPLSEIEESVARIEKLRSLVTMQEPRTLDQAVFDRHAALAAAVAQNPSWGHFEFKPDGFE